MSVVDGHVGHADLPARRQGALVVLRRRRARRKRQLLRRTSESTDHLVDLNRDAKGHGGQGHGQSTSGLVCLWLLDGE